jgi:glycosidase
MQWDDSENGGFTDGKPWFAANPNFKKINYKNQKADPESLLNYYKKLGALRKQEDLECTFIYGETIQLYKEMKGCLAYQRMLDDKVVTIIANWTSNVMEIPMDKPVNELLLNNYKTLQMEEESINFQPFQVIVFQ